MYACYGNHDIQEKILAGFTFGSKEKKESTPEMDEFLEKAGITLLRDEYVLIDDSFYLYGRSDYERPGRGIDKRKAPQEITEGMDAVSYTHLAFCQELLPVIQKFFKCKMVEFHPENYGMVEPEFRFYLDAPQENMVTCKATVK